MNRFGFNLAYGLAALAALLIVIYGWSALARQALTIPYSEFHTLLDHGKVERVSVGPDGREITGYLKAPLPDGLRSFRTTAVPPALARSLGRHGVEYSGSEPSVLWAAFATWIGPALLLLGAWVLLSRHLGGQGGRDGFMPFGKSRARLYTPSELRKTFADVAGANEAKEALKEIVDFLRNPESYSRLGGQVPKGVLLVGPPGTGKTLLARAIAGEARVPFLSMSGSEFVEMYVGVGAARARDLFQQARRRAPAIVFIDELDALGRARAGSASHGGSDEKDQTLNQVLVELDGFDPRARVVILAATNRPEVLDPALLRPGRFDRQVLVDRPDRRDRLEIATLYLRRVRAASDASPEKLAGLTVGLTGADIANVVNEAALIATRRGAEAIDMRDVTAASERVIAGLERRNRILTPRERRITAYHEMGHALVGLSLPGTDRVHKVSIVPRGAGALGYTIRLPTEDRFLLTREELDNKLAVLLGGRAAEHLVFGTVTTGAQDDLQKATQIARSMAMRFGMSEELGPVDYEGDEGGAPMLSHPGAVTRRYSELTAQRIDSLVQRTVQAALARAVSILRERRDALERGATHLLEHETLEECELAALAATAVNRAGSTLRPGEQPVAAAQAGGMPPSGW